MSSKEKDTWEKTEEICATENLTFRKRHSPCQWVLSSQIRAGRMEINAQPLTAGALIPALLFLGAKKWKGLGESWYF